MFDASVSLRLNAAPAKPVADLQSRTDVAGWAFCGSSIDSGQASAERACFQYYCGRVWVSTTSAECRFSGVTDRLRGERTCRLRCMYPETCRVRMSTLHRTPWSAQLVVGHRLLSGSFRRIWSLGSTSTSH